MRILFVLLAPPGGGFQNIFFALVLALALVLELPLVLALALVLKLRFDHKKSVIEPYFINVPRYK